MKKLFVIYAIAPALAAILYSAAQAAVVNPARDSLDVLKMTEVPEGHYEVQLQFPGTNQVTLAIQKNRAAFVRATDAKLDGLKGEFELIGNGVFMARLAGNNHRATQFWIFHPDGTASVKEVPDRGEKQTARPVETK